MASEKVETYVKKNKLKLASEADLKQVLAYYSEVTGGASTVTAEVKTN